MPLLCALLLPDAPALGTAFIAADGLAGGRFGAGDMLACDAVA